MKSNLFSVQSVKPWQCIKCQYLLCEEKIKIVSRLFIFFFSSGAVKYLCSWWVRFAFASFLHSKRKNENWASQRFEKKEKKRAIPLTTPTLKSPLFCFRRIFFDTIHFWESVWFFLCVKENWLSRFIVLHWIEFGAFAGFDDPSFPTHFLVAVAS